MEPRSQPRDAHFCRFDLIDKVVESVHLGGEVQPGWILVDGGSVGRGQTFGREGTVILVQVRIIPTDVLYPFRADVHPGKVLGKDVSHLFRDDLERHDHRLERDHLILDIEDARGIVEVEHDIGPVVVLPSSFTVKAKEIVDSGPYIIRPAGEFQAYRFFFPAASCQQKDGQC